MRGSLSCFEPSILWWSWFTSADIRPVRRCQPSPPSQSRGSPRPPPPSPPSWPTPRCFCIFYPPLGPCSGNGVVLGPCLQLVLQLHVHDRPAGSDLSLLSLSVRNPFPRQCCGQDCRSTRSPPMNLTSHVISKSIVCDLKLSLSV